MESKRFLSIKKLLILVIVCFLANHSVIGQRWSIEYVLVGDSLVYKRPQDKIIQERFVDFFFPAYKFNQTSSTKVIESVPIENNQIIEIEFNSKNVLCDQLNFEIDIYLEGIDSLLFFLKKTDNELILVKQQISPKGYTYLPTVFFSADFKSIQIVGKSNNENTKFILGRLNGFKITEFVAKNMQALDSYLSKYPFHQQSDLFDKLLEIEVELHGIRRYSGLVLNDCFSTFDSIQCISQFTNELSHKNQC